MTEPMQLEHHVNTASLPVRLSLLIVVAALGVAACSGDTGSQVASLTELTDSMVSDDMVTDDATVEDNPSDEEALLAFSACMREHGLEDFEDPDIGADGDVRFGFRDLAATADVDRETVGAAMDACRGHLDGLAIGPGSGDRTEIEDQLYEFAACMRDNGYDMPDPDFTGEPGQGAAGPFGEIDPDDPSFRSALESCEDVFGGALRFGGGRPGGGPDG